MIFSKMNIMMVIAVTLLGSCSDSAELHLANYSFRQASVTMTVGEIQELFKDTLTTFDRNDSDIPVNVYYYDGYANGENYYISIDKYLNQQTLYFTWGMAVPNIVKEEAAREIYEKYADYGRPEIFRHGGSIYLLYDCLNCNVNDIQSCSLVDSKTPIDATLCVYVNENGVSGIWANRKLIEIARRDYRPKLDL